MKKCPFCAEEIQEEALKCRFCGEFLDGRTTAQVKSKEPWYFKLSVLVILVLTIGPFALPLLWFNPKPSLTKKIIITIVVVIISVLLLKASVQAIDSIDQYYKMIVPS